MKSHENYPRGNPRETCPEVDGVVYSAEVYKIPRVRMQVEPTDKVSNVRGNQRIDRNVNTSKSLVDED